MNCGSSHCEHGFQESSCATSGSSGISNSEAIANRAILVELICVSHNLTVRSWLPLTSDWPSGLKATAETGLDVAAECEYLLASRTVPELSRVVEACSGKSGTVRTKH